MDPQVKGLESVWHIFEELKERMEEIDRQIREISGQIRESDRKLDKHFGIVRDPGRNLGNLLEFLMKPSVAEQFRKRGINLTGSCQRIERQMVGETMEIDMLLENRDVVIVVEIRTTLFVSGVDEHIEKHLEPFKRFFPRYQDKKVYGAIAYIHLEEDADRYAERKGLFVLTFSSDDGVTIQNGDEFVPSEWEDEKSSLIRELKSIVLSLDWEITDPVIQKLGKEIERLKKACKEVCKDDKVIISFLQLLDSIGKYIQEKKAEAHPDTMSLFNAVYENLETLMLSEGLSDAEKKKMFVTQVSRYKEIKFKLSQQHVTVEEDEASEDMDSVACTAFSPLTVEPGDTFLLQVFAHLIEKATEASNTVGDEDAGHKGCISLKTEIERDSRLTFHLEIKGLTIHDPVQTLIWKGRTESVAFDVEIPEGYPGKSMLGKVTVSQHSLPIGHIRLELKVVAGQKKDEPEPIGEAKRYKHAFVSCAPEDRLHVLPKVQMLSAIKISFFPDTLDLDPGERGEKMYQKIDEADVFFLFWSTAARDSEWVRKETLHAIEMNQRVGENPPEIIPVIIERPTPVPPKELDLLHFDDRAVYFIKQ